MADIYRLLTENGWKWLRYDGWNERDTFCFKASFTGYYEYEILASVACSKVHLNLDGHFGVLWLEVIGAPDQTFDKYNGPTYEDMSYMQKCIEYAEVNLVRCGVPFSPSYRFHGKNKANLKRRNDATRRKLGLDEYENAVFSEREAFNG